MPPTGTKLSGQRHADGLTGTAAPAEDIPQRTVDYY